MHKGQILKKGPRELIRKREGLESWELKDRALQCCRGEQNCDEIIVTDCSRVRCSTHGSKQTKSTVNMNKTNSS